VAEVVEVPRRELADGVDPQLRAGERHDVAHRTAFPDSVCDGRCTMLTSARLRGGLARTG
jgi:hypothetical protein